MTTHFINLHYITFVVFRDFSLVAASSQEILKVVLTLLRHQLGMAVGELVKFIWRTV